MTKIKVTINDTTYEFDSMEEAHKAFPAYIDIEKDIDDIFNETDMVFSAMDDVFARVDEVFKKVREVKNPKQPKTKKVYLYERATESSNRRFDIKAILKDPIEKARMIANAIRTARFFK